jgi:drug/metabolite transporter (DMT)-like permease
VAVVLALFAALAYGVTDFTAGIASRRLSAGPVTVVLQALGLLTAGVGVLVIPGIGPRATPLAFGALSGLGSTIGSLSLYHGMTKGRMAIVATLSAVLTAVLPVIFGLILGQPLTPLAAIGIILSIAAIALVSSQPGRTNTDASGSGAGYGLLSGAGFALLFIALDRAGTRSGAWPLIPGQAVALLSVLPFASPSSVLRRGLSRRMIALILVTGVLSATANLLFLAATGHGELAIVAVLSAMYPAITVLMARLVLAEKTTARQSLGLAVAAAAVVLVTIG